MPAGQPVVDSAEKPAAPQADPVARRMVEQRRRLEDEVDRLNSRSERRDAGEFLGPAVPPQAPPPHPR